MSQPGLNWQECGALAQSAQPAWLATYSAETRRWMKNSLKTASVAAPDCKPGKT